ncbi:SWIM zinc finger family protein [bacterium]|nr:SWIM zinc finger family protein [bacterium]
MARKRRYYNYKYEFFPPSTPIEAKGGIKAQSKQGRFGSSWWAKRWIEVLERFNIGARLGRGRTYARKGQVTSLEIEAGTITAQVQGSRPVPYEVLMKVKKLSESDWGKVVKTLASQPIYAAKLLAGEIPLDIESLFSELGLSLFPSQSDDLQTECRCPDWSNPCKHIAAVFYLLGEEFDRDPFLIFKMRGMTRKALLERLTPKSSLNGEQTNEASSETKPSEPLPKDPSQFWQAKELQDDFWGIVEIPSVHAAAPKSLGNFPFWRGQQRFLESMETTYNHASLFGLNVFIGEA